MTYILKYIKTYYLFRTVTINEESVFIYIFLITKFNIHILSTPEVIDET